MSLGPDFISESVDNKNQTACKCPESYKSKYGLECAVQEADICQSIWEREVQVESGLFKLVLLLLPIPEIWLLCAPRYPHDSVSLILGKGNFRVTFTVVCGAID